MIVTIIRLHTLRLIHGKLELALTFAVPIMFFTIFALIFDGPAGESGTTRIKVAFLDADQSPRSRQLSQNLHAQSGLRFVHQEAASQSLITTRDELETQVRLGRAAVGIYIPANWASAGSGGDEAPIELLSDTFDPIAHQVVAILVQREAIKTLKPQVAAREVRKPPLSTAAAGVPPVFDFVSWASLRPPTIKVVDVMGATKSNSTVSMYAAGIAVMFLLFSATAAGGTLLEEEESGTLERLLSTRVTMSQLLLGKWLFAAVVGFLQVSLMFAWAQLVFRVDVVGCLGGFLSMTAVTVLAASSFALLLATACRTRAQLNAVSIILILSMSALGGSMVPRYIMSETMQQAGLFTFNAWALDGYHKVFWRELPVSSLGPQLLVLGGAAVAMLAVARCLARRWETL